MRQPVVRIYSLWPGSQNRTRFRLSVLLTCEKHTPCHSFVCTGGGEMIRLQTVVATQMKKPTSRVRVPSVKVWGFFRASVLLAGWVGVGVRNFNYFFKDKARNTSPWQPIKYVFRTGASRGCSEKFRFGYAAWVLMPAWAAATHRESQHSIVLHFILWSLQGNKSDSLSELLTCHLTGFDQQVLFIWQL